MSVHIIDRRLNPGQKSLENRRRFLRRAKADVQGAVKDASGKAKVKDVLKGGTVSVPMGGVSEPRLHREGGTRDMVLPGNKKFSEGDYLSRKGGNKKKGQGSGEGDGEDAFRFVLSRDEFADLFLDDCELPNLSKKTSIGSDQTKPRRAGYTMSGSPTAMAVPKTIINGIARRIAFRGAVRQKIETLEAELLECTDEERKLSIAEELKKCQKRLERIAFIDPNDIRYRRFEQTPVPVAQAVMFCLMDVSGSMTEHMKDLAKRFYMLLYIFLMRRYKKVEVVFIRHTDTAEEVDEETFFYGPASGGTLVSSALKKMDEIVKERFPVSNWNIYVAQASDGDNYHQDDDAVAELMTNVILPVSQFFAYLEVADEGDGRVHYMSMLSPRPDSALWQVYELLCQDGADIAMQKVNHRGDIFPVFHKIFQKKGSEHVASS